MLAAIKRRRAIYPAQYNGEAVSRQEIELVLEAANWAPTHRRTEPWRFKVFHGSSQEKLGEFLGATYKETAEKYSEIKHRKIIDKPSQSACVIAICYQRDPKESVPEWEEIAATAMAVQNMWLAASELGIGAYWSSPSLKDHFHKLLPLAEGEKCLGFFYMGRYDQEEHPEGTRGTQIVDKTVWV